MHTLMINTAKKGSRYVNEAELHDLPVPDKMGRHHKPVPFPVLVNELQNGLADLGWSVAKKEYGINGSGSQLFGLYTLQGPEGWSDDLRPALGFRSSVNETLAIRAIAGAQVLVCDNLCLSGQDIVLSRKSTTHVQLGDLIKTALTGSYLQQTATLQSRVRALKGTPRGTGAVGKATIYQLFQQKVLPMKLFHTVSDLYFGTDRTPDVQPEHVHTLWDIHNVCTRAVKTLTPQAKFAAEHRIGKHFFEFGNLTVESN